MSRQVYNRADRNVIARGGLPRNASGREICKWTIGRSCAVRPTRDRRRLPASVASTAPDDTVVASLVGQGGYLITIRRGPIPDECNGVAMTDNWSQRGGIVDGQSVTIVGVYGGGGYTWAGSASDIDDGVDGVTGALSATIAKFCASPDVAPFAISDDISR